jgi:peroxiredoxin
MIELGELDKAQGDFQKREVRIVAASVDGPEDTQATQKRFPNLTLLSDPERSLVKALKATHASAGPGGADVAAPTTLLLDRNGRIAWTHRPERVLSRLSSAELLAVAERHLR